MSENQALAICPKINELAIFCLVLSENQALAICPKINELAIICLVLSFSDTTRQNIANSLILGQIARA
jgi:hypothetical protein